MSGKLKRVLLSSGKWRAELLPEYACNLIRLRCGEEDIIRTPASDGEFVKDHIVYGTAFLLPPDRTIGGSFFFQGKEYRLPINDSRKLSNIHGLMSDAPFKTVSLTESAAEFVYENKGERYPFPFRATVKCSLDEGCAMEYSFENTGGGDMPLLFGLHANFADMGFVKVPVEEEMPMNTETLVPDLRTVPLSGVGREIRDGTDPHGKEISCFFTAAGKRAEIGDYSFTVSDTFSHWVVWNGTGCEGFISVEPENGPVNGLKTEGKYALIRKGGTLRFTTDIRRK